MAKQLYLILDHFDDAKKLLAHARSPNCILVPISAIGSCGVPDKWPEAQLLPLANLIRPQQLANFVIHRRRSLRAFFKQLPNCPYYKSMQIIDVFTEKEVIVDQLAALDGEKWFIGQRNAKLSVDSDNKEQVRIASIYMQRRPGFIEKEVEKLSTRQVGLRANLRLIKEAATTASSHDTGDVVFGEGGYQTEPHFENAPRLLGGNILAQALKRPFSGWRDAWYLLRHTRPVPISNTSDCYGLPYLSALNEIQSRATRLRTIAAKHLPTTQSIKAYFTVKYGRLIDTALVRTLKSRGALIVSMQHALVGHDHWGASQYLDAWLSDAKIVSTPKVAAVLKTLEENKECQYLPCTVPILRRKPKQVQWTTNSLLYVLTGFTRNNTMYDKRRINDQIYFERAKHKLKAFEDFDTLIRPHPYDARQYKNQIAQTLSAYAGAKICHDAISSVDAAIVIDSPSTVLSDCIVAGRPVFLINETASLDPAFRDMAETHNILFDNAVKLAEFLSSTQRHQILNSCSAFAHAFAQTYFGDDARGLKDVIHNWLESGPIANPRREC